MIKAAKSIEFHSMIIMNGGMVQPCSLRQTATALCTAMAETILLANLVFKMKHLRFFVFEVISCVISTDIKNIAFVLIDDSAALPAAKVWTRVPLH
jgi:hypothetical protein